MEEKEEMEITAEDVGSGDDLGEFLGGSEPPPAPAAELLSFDLDPVETGFKLIPPGGYRLALAEVPTVVVASTGRTMVLYKLKVADGSQPGLLWHRASWPTSEDSDDNVNAMLSMFKEIAVALNPEIGGDVAPTQDWLDDNFTEGMECDGTVTHKQYEGKPQARCSGFKAPE